MSKNILELCLAHGLGGLEMFVAHCYDDFSKRGECKVVVAPQTKLDNYLENIDKFSIKRNKFFPFIPALKLAKYIDENDIDIVHFHWTKDIVTAVLAKFFSKKKPKLVQSRHMRMTRFKDDFYHRWLYKSVDLMHAVTKDVAKQLQKFIPQTVRPKIEMIYLGVGVPSLDKKKIENLKEKYQFSDSFIVGIVGRIEEGKGQHKVIEAVASLQNKNITALIVGSAMNETYLEKLKEKVHELGIEKRVIFTGFTKEVNEHMALCDTVVLATENETFGLVVIEAMANKKAVIATAKGGPLEIIDDGVDGILFDGSAKDLSKKIEFLYEQKDIKKELEENALKKVQEKFEKSKQLEKLYKVITA